MPISSLLPGGIGSTLFSILLCVLSIYLAFVRSADAYLIILDGFSLSLYSFVLFSLMGHACLGLAQQRNCVLNGDHFKFIQHAGLLLGLTIIQSIIWIAALVISMTDIQISKPLLFSLGLAYIQLSIHIVQILGLFLVIYEVQSSPRRVLSDRSLQQLLDKNVPTLLDLREEAKRVRLYFERDSRFEYNSSPKSPCLRRSSTQDNLIMMRSRSLGTVRFDMGVEAGTEDVDGKDKVKETPRRSSAPHESRQVVDLTSSPPMMYRKIDQ